jgi:hypothetical protein
MNATTTKIDFHDETERGCEFPFEMSRGLGIDMIPVLRRVPDFAGSETPGCSLQLGTEATGSAPEFVSTNRRPTVIRTKNPKLFPEIFDPAHRAAQVDQASTALV